MQGRAVLGMLTYYLYAPLPALRPLLPDDQSPIYEMTSRMMRFILQALPCLSFPRCAVRAAEQRLFAAAAPHDYQPIDGNAAYNAAVQKLLFGADSAQIAQGRIVTVQALGGTGALKIGADFLKFLNPNAKAAISAPSWENHRALFEAAGFEVSEYAYYDATTHGVQFD